MKYALPVIAIVLALFALARSGGKSVSEDPAWKATQRDIAEFRERVEKLERTSKRPIPQTIQIEKVEPAAILDRGEDMAELRSQLVQLQNRLSSLEQGFQETRLAAERAPSPVRLTPEQIAGLQQQALNYQASATERLRALRELRSANARSAEVVHAMIQLAQTANDSRVRADVFRNLSGIQEPALRQPLLNGLLDTDREVREEAAETLVGFLPDPQVQAALEHVAQHDAEEKVRRQATASLHRR